jgi:hypothetical protein
VNDAGMIAMSSTDFPSSGGRVGRWYIQTGSTRTMHDAGIYDISNGAAAYVVGYNGNGARWTYSLSTGFSAGAVLPGIPAAVNDLGNAVGVTPDGAAIMRVDGTTITQANPNPSAFTNTQAEEINSSDDIVITYQDSYAATPDRGYLRTADGVMIEFSPLAGHNSTYVRGVSDRIDGKIYVAGISDDDNGKFNAIRWTVDVATHSITSTEVGAPGTYSVGMSGDGMVVGVISGQNATPFVWKRGGSVTALKAPKGLSNAVPRGVSANGRYIVGDGAKGSYRRAILWTAQ